ncbi:MAG: glycoside hydrolase family 32 protein [Mangrovibacterium sp.]
MRNLFCWLKIIALLLPISVAAADKRPFNEVYRPQFHFTPEENRMGEPAGLVWIDGEYHLFYVYNPFGLDNIFSYWGHAVSTDLLHWEHLPLALTPDRGKSRDPEFGNNLPGSVLVDRKNFSGLQQGEEPVILAFYTSRMYGQCMAYSRDKGRSWTKYEGNPLIPFDPENQTCHPKVFWSEAGRHFVMMLSRQPGGDDSRQGLSFYSSENLTDWTFESHLPGFQECSELVELPVEGRAGETCWILFERSGSWFAGSFDGRRFIPGSPRMQSDFGANYQAPKCWSNLPEADGRIVSIAWMRGGTYPDMPFNGQLSFPCELSLKAVPEGFRLERRPVRELENLLGKGMKVEGKTVIPGLNKNPLKGVKEDCLYIRGTFVLNKLSSFGFLLRHGRDQNGTEIRYDATKNVLSFLGCSAGLLPENGKLSLTILMDRSSVEIFGREGQPVISSCFVPEPESREVLLYNTGGELDIERLEVFPVRSVYPEK